MEADIRETCPLGWKCSFADLPLEDKNELLHCRLKVSERPVAAIRASA